jgi:hypothetical protein
MSTFVRRLQPSTPDLRHAGCGLEQIDLGDRAQWQSIAAVH